MYQAVCWTSCMVEDQGAHFVYNCMYVNILLLYNYIFGGMKPDIWECMLIISYNSDVPGVQYTIYMQYTLMVVSMTVIKIYYTDTRSTF